MKPCFFQPCGTAPQGRSLAFSTRNALKSKQDMFARTEAVTLSVRPCTPRAGTTHTYTLNGTLLRDVLVDGVWVTVHAGNPIDSRAA
jgi:hypothetical protein